MWQYNNIDTGCGGLSAVTPVRFTPLSAPLGQPGAGYYIGPGSWWISDMRAQPLHYDYDCCHPAVLSSPARRIPTARKAKSSRCLLPSAMTYTARSGWGGWTSPPLMPTAVTAT